MYNCVMKLILGSKSFGRREVLEKAGYRFEVMTADIDEEAIRHDDLEILPLLIARGKTEALLPRINEDTILITSDQVVDWKGELREKPKDALQARNWLKSYEYYPSKAITSVVVTNTQTGERAEGVDIVYVHFKKIPHDVIDKLISQGRILQAAGACIGEDPLVKPYIERLDGDMDSLMGMPLKLTERLVKEVGLDLNEFL